MVEVWFRSKHIEVMWNTVVRECDSENVIIHCVAIINYRVSIIPFHFPIFTIALSHSRNLALNKLCYKKKASIC